MCGISGIVGPQASQHIIEAMSASLAHRGPNDSGIYLDPDKNVALGHRRLSIIDLSEAGRQPMSNQDDSIWITYNGEVYNFRSLKKLLQSKPYSYKSNTDTEVILHLYEEKEKGCLEALNGIFALAIYDKTREKLILARDRAGVKPLYYAYKDGHFLFASEIKAILKSGLIQTDIDWQAAYDYFSYLYVPHPQTIFKDIKQLPPGCHLTFDLKTKAIDIESYWNPDLSETIEDYPMLKESLIHLLKDSVKRQLISDVPLGVFLSGGMDSTVLVGLMAQCSSERVKTFTVLFEGEGIKPYDETEYARRVSQQFGTEHHELVVNVSKIDDLFDLVSCFDQPFANPTFYLSYLISKQTKRYVTVALSGAGGDELFGGYPRYRALSYATFLQKMPKHVSRWTEKLLRLIPENYEKPTIRRAKLLARGLSHDLPEQYLRWTYYFSQEEKDRLLKQNEFDSSVRFIEKYLQESERFANDDLHKRILFLDLNMFLADNILEYTDKTSMAVALEVRVPFLDHRVVQLGFKIPFKYKIKNGTTKYILKDTFRDLIPAENLNAPKRGFCPPLAAWMDKYLDRYFDDFLTKEYADRQGIFNWDYIQLLRDQHKQRKRDNSMELFGIIMFDVWYRKYIP